MKNLTTIKKGIVAIIISFTLFGVGHQLIDANSNVSNAGNEASQAADNINAIIEGLE